MNDELHETAIEIDAMLDLLDEMFSMCEKFRTEETPDEHAERVFAHVEHHEDYEPDSNF